MFHLNGKICRNKYHPERRTYDIPLSLIYYFLGIGFIQQATNMHTVGAVHERPGSAQSVFRIRLGAFAERGLCRRMIRESPLRSYGEACCVKPMPIFYFLCIICPNSFLQGCIIQVRLYAKKKRTDYSVPFSQKLRSSLRLSGELVLADAAELAGKIVGQVFPLGALLVLIIDPAAYIANVLHW